MKKETVSNPPQIKFVESEGNFDFLKGRSLFAEKHARAKKILSTMKIPETFIAK
jgi:hypothetical protein